MNKIIDCHTHIGFGGAIIASVEDLLLSMDDAKIDQAVVFAGDINECPTEKLVEAIAPHLDRLTAVGSISPHSPSRPEPQQVKDWLEAGTISGLKFYLGYEYFYPADGIARPYLKLLSEQGKPAIFHCGDLYDKVGAAKLKYAHPGHIDDLATDLPELRIIMAHMGWPYVVDAAHVCAKNQHVYADVSGLVYGPFDDEHRKEFRKSLKTFKRFAGSLDKLIFGSDWPISDQSSYIEVVRDLVPDKLDALCQRTPESLFGFL